MTDEPKATPPKHTGGKFKKGVSGNPGGKKKAYVPSQVVPNPAPAAAPAPATAPQDDPQAAPQAASAARTHAKVEQPGNAGTNAGARQRRAGTFQPGQSGNPAGKAKGTKNHATRLVEALIDGQAEELASRAVELAMAGDASVMRALLDRLIAPRKDRPVSIAMPKINTAADLIAAAAALTSAVGDGEITPGEAASLSTLVANTAKAVETFELADRLARLEEQMAAKGSNP
jgi:hypothetical protein